MAVRLNKEDIDAIAKHVLGLMRECNHIIIEDAIEDADGKEWITEEKAAAILNLLIKNHITHRKGYSIQKMGLFSQE